MTEQEKADEWCAKNCVREIKPNGDIIYRATTPHGLTFALGSRQDERCERVARRGMYRFWLKHQDTKRRAIRIPL